MPKVFHQGTNKRGLIVYDGESSSDYGMVIAEAPSFDSPVRKQTIYNVPGRNGAIVFQQDAWEDVPKAYRVWTANDLEDLATKVRAFLGMLNSKKGYLRLEDNFEPEIYRLAYISGGNDFSNVLTAYGEATLNFTCRAEKFYKAGELPITVTNGDEIYNPTRYTSKPLIHIEGSGAVTIASGGNTISATVTDYINIDCESMNAYHLANENYNDKISGAFPVLVPGANAIGITGTTTLVTITPRFFTI